MAEQIIAAAILVIGSVAGHYVLRGIAGPPSNIILQWLGSAAGAALAAIVLLCAAFAVDPPDGFDLAMVFAQVAPIVGAVAAAVEFALLACSPSRNRTWIQMVVMFGIGCVCISWFLWYRAQLGRRWEAPPPAPVSIPEKGANQ
jgi:hypothetical protein